LYALNGGEAKAYYDAVSAHPSGYSNPPNCTPTMPACRNLLRKQPERPALRTRPPTMYVVPQKSMLVETMLGQVRARIHAGLQRGLGLPEDCRSGGPSRH
jgi:hypothetical protein